MSAWHAAAGEVVASPTSRRIPMSLAILDAGPTTDSAPGGHSSPLPCNTKIVATLGPACAALEKVRELVAAGVNDFRLNFSHSDHSWHEELLARVRQAAAEAGVSVAVLQDLC